MHMFIINSVRDGAQYAVVGLAVCLCVGLKSYLVHYPLHYLLIVISSDHDGAQYDVVSLAVYLCVCIFP